MSCGGSSWTNYTWNFNDGSQSSCVLNRSDSEYLNYLQQVNDTCRTISQSQFFWKPGSGNDSDWQSFGIPDCSTASAFINSDSLFAQAIDALMGFLMPW